MRTYTHLLCLLLIALPFAGNSQVTTFQKTFVAPFTCAAMKICYTSDGGFAFIGQCAAGVIPLVKIDVNGTIQWQRQYSVTNINTVDEILETSSGQFLISGVTMDAAYVRKYILLKISGTGSLTWAKEYDPAPAYALKSDGFGTSTLNHDSRGSRCELTQDGGFVFAGWVESFLGDNFIQLNKIDSAGNLLWSSVTMPFLYISAFDLTVCTSGKLSGDEKFYFVIDNSKGFVVTEFSATGVNVWANEKLGLGVLFDATAIQYTTDNHLLISGLCTNQSQASTKDLLLIKTDSSGTITWAKQYDGLCIEEWGNSIDNTLDGNYIIAYGQSTGFGNASAGLIKVSPTGTIIWSNLYDSIPGYTETCGISVVATATGDYVFSGFATIFLFTHDMYLVKTDGTGNAGCYTSPLNLLSLSSPYLENTFQLGSSSTLSTSNFSPVSNSASVNDNTVCSVLTSTEEVPSNMQIEMIPNPAEGHFTLYFAEPTTKAIVRIHDAAGQMVLEQNEISSGRQIDISGLSDGMYFVTCTEGFQRQVTMQLIIH